MHHHRPKVGRHAFAQHAGDIAPIGNGRDAGPAELQDDPAFAVFKHGNERAWRNLGACLSILREPRWQGEGADARRAARPVVVPPESRATPQTPPSPPTL